MVVSPSFAPFFEVAGTQTLRLLSHSPAVDRTALQGARMAYSIEKAPPTDEAVNKLLAKVGGTLELALNSQELKWSSKRLNADDAHVVAYVVAFSTVLQKLVLGANSIGDAGASSIAEAHTNSASLTLGLPTSDNSSHHSPLYTLPNSAGAQGQQRAAHACSRQLVRGQQHR